MFCVLLDDFLVITIAGSTIEILIRPKPRKAVGNVKLGMNLGELTAMAILTAQNINVGTMQFLDCSNHCPIFHIGSLYRILVIPGLI